MLTHSLEETWSEFLRLMKERCSRVEYTNWIAPIKLNTDSDKPIFFVPNVFVREYLLDNYREELCTFFGSGKKGEPDLKFIVKEQKQDKPKVAAKPRPRTEKVPVEQEMKLNENYTFDHFIEGPSNPIH